MLKFCINVFSNSNPLKEPKFQNCGLKDKHFLYFKNLIKLFKKSMNFIEMLNRVGMEVCLKLGWLRSNL